MNDYLFNTRLETSSEFIRLMKENPDQTCKLIQSSIGKFRDCLMCTREDLVQDIYLYLLKVGFKYDGKVSNPSTFIFGCAQQYLLNVYRDIKKSPVLDCSNDILDLLKNKTVEMEQSVENKDLYNKIMSDERDPAIKLILQSKFERGMTLAEISALPGVGYTPSYIRYLLDQWAARTKALLLNSKRKSKNISKKYAAA